MIDWITAHSTFLQVVLSTLTAVVWIVYLQVFLTSFRRQRRPEILVTLGAGAGLKARCFVTNLGLEPVYISDVMVELETEPGTREAIITDRTELSEQQLRNPAEATNQGPLASAACMDIGSVQTLISRAATDDGEDAPEDLRRIAVTVVAATAAKGTLVGARREWEVVVGDGRVDLKATGLAAGQNPQPSRPAGTAAEAGGDPGRRGMSAGFDVDYARTAEASLRRGSNTTANW